MDFPEYIMNNTSTSSLYLQTFDSADEKPDFHQLLQTLNDQGNHVHPDSEPVTSSEPFLERITRNKKDIRRRCTKCYHTLTKEKGPTYAASRTKRVTTRCSVCKTWLCQWCFENIHPKCGPPRIECGRSAPVMPTPVMGIVDEMLLNRSGEQTDRTPSRNPQKIPSTINDPLQQSSSSRNNEEFDINEFIGTESSSLSKPDAKRPRLDEETPKTEAMNPLFLLLSKKFSQYEREMPDLAEEMESDLLGLLQKYDKEAKSLKKSQMNES
ncbi:unnamed protein product, partial [Mesorhabditis belari]|uniref:Uncharacterized protein n=1 Tax=Mesorhabditis belari TaxID=2138241 RepID=A0AAF3JCC3_9BILA